MLDNNITYASKEDQWNAIMSASAVASGRYDTEISYSLTSILNQINTCFERLTLGVRAKYPTNPKAGCGGHFGLTGTTLQDEAINITVENFFSDGYTGGKIKAQANSYPTTESDSPVNFNGIMTRRAVYAEALDKPNENYLFNDTEATDNKSIWQKFDGNLIPKSGFSITASANFLTNSEEKNYHYRALMKRQYVLTFENPGHSISINGVTVSSPNSPKIVEENTVNAYGEGPIVENGIVKQFDHWVDNTGQSIVSPITATETKTYTAYYRFYEAAIPNFTFGTVVGQPVQLIWTDNPNTSVTQYGIYRRVCTNGVWGPSEQIGTVGRNVGTFSDPLYVLGVWKNDILLEYGMNAYYAPENHWSHAKLWSYRFGKAQC